MKITGFKDTIDWYDKNGEEYADSMYTVAPIDKIERFLKILPPDPLVLDAGCGAGRDSKIFYEKGAKVIGIDISEGLLAEARKRNPDIEFIYGDFRKLPFSEKMFDGVWSHASLVHFETIEDVRESLAEFHRVLKNKGKIFIYVKMQTGKEKTAIVADKLSKHERFFRYYMPEEIEKLVADAGFKILKNKIHEDSHGRTEVKWIEVIGEI